MAPLLPFLYQTRTILSRPCPQTLCRLLHTSPAIRARYPSDFHDGPPTAYPQRRRSNFVRKDQHPRRDRVKQRDVGLDREHEVTSSGSNIPFAQSHGEGVQRDTITIQERETFRRIFSDIAARGLKPRYMEGESAAPVSPTVRSVNTIIADAAMSQQDTMQDATLVSPAMMAGIAKDRNKALLRFPPGLREAAARALDIIQPPTTMESRPTASIDETIRLVEEEEDDEVEMQEWESPENSVARNLELEARRQPERTRVEDLLTSAKTDFELWEVMEKEVFTMPERLGIGKFQSKEATKPARARGKKSAAARTSSVTIEKLNLSVWGPLYPAYLLLGLRRLDSGFSSPSPLALAVLPRVKELGLESYVLGVSTPFYNELLQILWGRHANLHQVLQILTEMSDSGLYFDEQTYSVLSNIHDQTNGLAEGPSSFANAIMSMPEFEQSLRDKVRSWHRVVKSSIRQREEDLGFSQPN